MTGIVLADHAHAFRWLGAKTALRRVVDTLRAARGVDDIRVVATTGYAADRLRDLLPDDVPAWAVAAAAGQEVDAACGCVRAAPPFVVVRALTPFLTPSTVERCLAEAAAHPGSGVVTVISRDVIVWNGHHHASARPGPCLVQGVRVHADRPDRPDRLVAVGAVEAIDVGSDAGWQVGTAVAEFGGLP